MKFNDLALKFDKKCQIGDLNQPPTRIRNPAIQPFVNKLKFLTYLDRYSKSLSEYVN